MLKASCKKNGKRKRKTHTHTQNGYKLIYIFIIILSNDFICLSCYTLLFIWKQLTVKLYSNTFDFRSKTLRWHSYTSSISADIKTFHMEIKVSHLTFDSNYFKQFTRIIFDICHLYKRCEEVDNTLCNAFIRASSLLVTTTLGRKSLCIKPLKFYGTCV